MLALPFHDLCKTFKETSTNSLTKLLSVLAVFNPIFLIRQIANFFYIISIIITISIVCVKEIKIVLSAFNREGVNTCKKFFNPLHSNSKCDLENNDITTV